MFLGFSLSLMAHIQLVHQQIWQLCLLFQMHVEPAHHSSPTMAPTLARFAGMTEVASSLVPCLDFHPLQSLFQMSGRSYEMKVRPCLAFPCEYKLGSLQCLHGRIGSAPLASPKVTSCFSLPSHCTPSTLPSYSPSNKPGVSLPQDLCTIYFLPGMLFLRLRM